MQKQSDKDAIKIVAPILKSGGIGVIPTDTLYGIVGSALRKETVERIYHLRKRGLNKAMIILISSVNDLKKFGTILTAEQKKILKNIWPGKVSVILPCGSNKFQYLHRGKKTLAFRLPKEKNLIDLLKKSGPLVAPSANFEGEKPAISYKEAREYFNEDIEFYIDAGKLSSKPSTLIELAENGSIKVLREGAIKIK